MIVCDRCKKNPGRLFAYGDAINESYNYADLCYDCANILREIIIRYKHGEEIITPGPKDMKKEVR